MRRTGIILLVVFAVGLLTGAYLQHRWPLGRVLAPRAPVTHPSSTEVLATVRKTPADRRRVVVILGQSNAANYGSTRRHAGPGVHAYFDGQLYAAADPLPGGDAAGGTPWTRLGARWVTMGQADHVVLALVALGSTRATDFAAGGRLHDRLRRTLRDLETLGLNPNFVLWQQGETEGSDPHSGGAEYLSKLQQVIATCHELAPNARVVVARATRTRSTPPNEQIRAAQARAADLPGAQRGPDLDQLGDEYRSDGVHFNERGLDAVADAWLQCLQMPPRNPPT